MSTFQKCGDDVRDLANEILCAFETHKSLLDAKIRIDFLFAFPNKDEDGNYVGDAIRHHGQKAYGLTRKIGLKERTAGRADAEILMDGEWWNDATPEKRRALLDHELHHIDIRKDEDGGTLRDDLKRPLVRMRQHDVSVGWFAIVAARHGTHSLERTQAKIMMDKYAQFYWPELVNPQSVAA